MIGLSSNAPKQVSLSPNSHQHRHMSKTSSTELSLIIFQKQPTLHLGNNKSTWSDIREAPQPSPAQPLAMYNTDIPTDGRHLFHPVQPGGSELEDAAEPSPPQSITKASNSTTNIHTHEIRGKHCPTALTWLLASAVPFSSLLQRQIDR